MSDDEPSGDNASDERQLFGEERETTVGYVASEMGVVRIDLAGDRIGSYSLLERCRATAIATAGAVVAVGTDEDVLVDVGDTGECQRLHFGPAVAVGIDGDTVFAAGPEGELGRFEGVSNWFRTQREDGIEHDSGVQDGAGVHEGAGLQEGAEIPNDEPTTPWETLGTVSGPNRMASQYLAADAGVFELGESVDGLGLSAVADVATDDGDENAVLAGTEHGLSRRAGDATDWSSLDTEPVRRVVADGDYLTITDEGIVRERAGEGWRELSLPTDDQIVDIARGESLYAVTSGGDLCMAASSDKTSDGYDGWRSQPVGVRDVVGLAVLEQ
jgi:hypothetical protein